MQPSGFNRCLSRKSLKLKTMKTTKTPLIILIALFISTISFAQQTINKSFNGVKNIRLSTASGNGTIKKGTGNEVKVTLEYTFDDEIYKPTFEQDGDRLIIDERFERSRSVRGYAEWTLEIPDGLELEFKTGSGNIEVVGLEINVLAKSGSGNIEMTDVTGEFRMNTGSGNIDLANVKGENQGNTGSGNIRLDRVEGNSDFNTGSGSIRGRSVSGAMDFNTGSGNITIDGATIQGNSRMNTGSGNAEVILEGELNFDLSLNTGSGNSILDFNGTAIAGEFRMEASSKSDIRAPFEFDRVSEKESGWRNSKRYTKEAKVGNKDIQIVISTGSGVSQVRK